MYPFRTLPDLLRYVQSTYDAPNALNYPHDGGWVSYSHKQFAERVRRLALALEAMGVRRGERVGLIAPSSPDWLIVDLAIQSAGAVTVPVFNKISPESFLHEVRDSGMRYLFAGNPEEIPLIHEHKASLKEVITFWYSGTHERYESLFEEGRSIERERPERYGELCSAISDGDLATVIYTSGSTGLPKGVELTQRNIVSQVAASAERFPRDHTDDICLSLLPLAHIFERMVMYFYVAGGIPVYFVDDPKEAAGYIRSVQPTIMTVVPRVLEKVYTAIKERADEAHGIERLLIRGAIRRASEKEIERRFFGPLDAIYRRVVYPRFRDALSRRFRYLICGSSKLEPQIARFFTNIGIPIYEGYGLTEASPVISANGPRATRIGTVGKPFPGVEVKIASDGEILARGPNIMRAYHKNRGATDAAIDDSGWLHTGDLGSFDGDGYLRISGRKKELFKKSTGEYVPPAPIEYALSQIPYVDTAMIIADNRTYVTALLFPETEKLASFKERYGLANMTDSEFLKSEFLHTKTKEYINEINRHRHHCEWIERFTILDHAAAIETGELTPSMKLRRFHIEEMYRDTIEQMYSSIGGWK